jgi:hypothetical protein
LPIADWPIADVPFAKLAGGWVEVQSAIGNRQSSIINHQS